MKEKKIREEKRAENSQEAGFSNFLFIYFDS